MLIEIHQIKKLSLFKFIFVSFIPVGIVFSLGINLIGTESIDLTTIVSELITALVAGIMFSALSAFSCLFGAWIIGIFKPDFIVLRTDGDYEKLKGAFK